jgi:hypothetical protein
MGRRNSDLLTDSAAISIQYFTPTNPPPPPANIYREKERFLGGGGIKTNVCRGIPSIGRYSDDVKVCIGFYLDSYSLSLPLSFPRLKRVLPEILGSHGGVYSTYGNSGALALYNQSPNS